MDIKELEIPPKELNESDPYFNKKKHKSSNYKKLSILGNSAPPKEVKYLSMSHAQE